MADTHDALLLMSFGGPEGPDDVMPFLRNVTAGRDVPDARLAVVAEQYEAFGGRSPINDQNRELVAAIERDFSKHGIELPVYFGNRNWHPYIGDTVEHMIADGVTKPLAFVTSAFSSYSGCRQYRNDMAEAVERASATLPGRIPAGFNIDKIRAFWNHPGFVEAVADRLGEAVADAGDGAHIVFTAHSIPTSMASSSDYELQLRDACRLVSDEIGVEQQVDLAFQSRSGPPQVPWLEPDINDRLEALAASGVTDVVIAPIGFLSDHMEVVYDLDTQARETADRLGITMTRAATPGTHPRFVEMVRELVQERLDPASQRRFVGPLGARPDVCAADCCPAPQRPMRPSRPAVS